jgi:hypothetical protein
MDRITHTLLKRQRVSADVRHYCFDASAEDLVADFSGGHFFKKAGEIGPRIEKASGV